MPILELTGVLLLYVGVVLFINSLWLLGKIETKEIVFVNAFVGFVSFLIAFHLIFDIEATNQTIRSGALTLLFSCTYFWIAFNNYTNTNGKALGWYCLFVALTAIPVTISGFMSSHSALDILFSSYWALWAILWFAYFIHLVLLKIETHYIGLLTLFAAVVSAWLPGYMLISGLLK